MRRSLVRAASPSLIFCSRCRVAAVAAQPGRDPSGGRPARHRDRGHALRRPAGRRPGDPLLPARHHDRLAQEGRRQQRQGEDQDRRRLPARPARPAGPDGDRDQRAADLQRRGTQGDHRGRAQQRLRGPAGDPDERDGQRRRRQRRRRLLRGRGQEGRADLGRGRRACGWGSPSSTRTSRS